MKTVLITIVTGMIVAWFSWWLTQDRYTVKYTVSEQIPLRFGGVQQEAIQQIEVRNVGKTLVQSIQVKVPAELSEFQILKNSEADEAKTFENQGTFELVYASLPPQSSFRLVFKTNGPGIPKTDVQVKHSRGSAEEALSSESPFKMVTNWIQIVIILFYLGLGLQSLRNVGVDSWEHVAKYNAEKALRASKPFYITNDKWHDIRHTASENFGRSENFTYGNVTDTEILAWPLYRWLNEDKPLCLSEDEWQQFRASKSNQFIGLFRRRISEGWLKAKDLRSLLRISRPRQVTPEAWDSVQQGLEERYVSLRADEIFRDLAENIQISQDDVDSKLWSRVETAVGISRFARLSEDIEYTRSPIDFLNNQNLYMLTVKQTDQLKELAYRRQITYMIRPVDETEARTFLQAAKPTWILDDDYDPVRKAAERIVSNIEQGQRNEIRESSLLEILRGRPLSQAKIDGLDDESKRQLRELDESLRTGIEKNSQDAINNANEAKALSEIKAKILRQLQIIEELLADPASIDRIEPYDNPFVIGNFEILRRVSRLLLEASKP